MKYRAIGVLTSVLAAFVLAATAGAHHEILAKFDDTKPTTLNGVVTEVDWANPHVHIFMNVRTGNQNINWAVELASPIDLVRSGWNEESVQPGDALTVQGITARNGSRQAWAKSIVMTKTNKAVLTVSRRPPACYHRADAEMARWPDSPRSLPGADGYWLSDVDGHDR